MIHILLFKKTTKNNFIIQQKIASFISIPFFIECLV
jgi:hypothetical protein